MQSIASTFGNNQKSKSFELAYWYFLCQEFWKKPFPENYPEFKEDILNSKLETKISDKSIEFVVYSPDIHFLSWVKQTSPDIIDQIKFFLKDQSKLETIQEIKLKCYSL